MKQIWERFKKIMNNQLVKWFVYAIITFAIIGICFQINDILGYITFSIPALFIIYLSIQGLINVIRDAGTTEKLYLIKKGRHYCNRLLSSFKFVGRKYKIEKSMMMTRSCLYHFNDIDDADKNKLWGITFGYNPLKNSIRFGWNCLESDGSISMYAYIHKNSETYSTPLLHIQPDQYYLYTIKVDNNTVELLIDNKLLGAFELNTSKFIVINKPYFGGNKVAPQEMLIYEHKLK